MAIGASGADRPTLLLSAVAATVAGAMSMAAGEYVSVQSQADTEAADLARERQELAADPAGELAELTEIYRQRGLESGLARQVAEQLTLRDALSAHARDELGLSETLRARPLQAALASAFSFALGAILPLLTLLLAPPALILPLTTLIALISLAGLGGLAAWAGGAATAPAALRMLIWGAVAILLQLLAFRAADLILRDLPRRIERDETGAALVLAAVKIAAAIVMASAL